MAQPAAKLELEKPSSQGNMPDRQTVVTSEDIEAEYAKARQAAYIAAKAVAANTSSPERPMSTRILGGELVTGLRTVRLALSGAIVGAALAGLASHLAGAGGITIDLVGAGLGFLAVLTVKMTDLT
jgi:hypothetical protein